MTRSTRVAFQIVFFALISIYLAETCAARLIVGQQGAQKQGIKTHIRTKKKLDNTGVGQAEAARRAQDWTLDMCKFAAALSSMKEVVSKHASTAAENDSDADTNTDDVHLPGAAVTALAAPTVAAALQSRPPPEVSTAERPAKRKRNASVADPVQPAVQACTLDESNSAPVTASAATAADASSKSNKAAKHAGRYAKRERNKLVKGYSATDLAAILGHSAPAEPAAAPATVASSAKQAPDRPLLHQKGRPSAPPAASTDAGEGAVCSRIESEPAGAQVDHAKQWWSTMFSRYGAPERGNVM